MYWVHGLQMDFAYWLSLRHGMCIVECRCLKDIEHALSLVYHVYYNWSVTWVKLELMLMSIYILNKRGKSLNFSTIKVYQILTKTINHVLNLAITKSLIYFKKKYTCPLIKLGHCTKSKSRKRTKHYQSSILWNSFRAYESGWLADRDTTQTS